MISSVINLFGCFLLVPAPLLLNFPRHYRMGIKLYVISCALLMIASIIDLVRAQVCRTRTKSKQENDTLEGEVKKDDMQARVKEAISHSEISYHENNVQEQLNSLKEIEAEFQSGSDSHDMKDGFKTFFILSGYFCGSTCLEMGSLLFLPENCDECVFNGIWMYRLASIIYLCSTGAAMSKLGRREVAKRIGSILYMTGSTCYLAGGLLSQLQYAESVPIVLWTAAGVMFSLGALIFSVKTK
eukprot:m.30921 g.30921  ORF g.30921 m.30921 type:complete len:242 (-) comp8257_c0_seq1:93-818(-)